LPIRTLGVCPGSVSDSNFHTTRWDNSENASRNAFRFSNVNMLLRRIEPRLSKINPSFASSKNNFKSCYRNIKFRTFEKLLLNSFEMQKNLFLIHFCINNNNIVPVGPSVKQTTLGTV